MAGGLDGASPQAVLLETKPPPPHAQPSDSDAAALFDDVSRAAAEKQEGVEISTTFGEGLNLVRPDGAEWQAHPVWQGTSVKLLYHDPLSGDYTALVKLDPGATLPSRKHAKAEEMWMIAGIALMAQVRMRPGEYARADQSSTHPSIHSVLGCTFLLRGSEHDEVLL